VSDLAPDRVVPLLLGPLGAPYLYAEQTGSTQNVLHDGDHPHGAVAVAEHQTAGRGRAGRVWEDAPSRALLFSVLLRPDGDAPLPQLSLVAGLAVAAAVEATAGVETGVKWPNDVLVGGRKVAGILLEASGAKVVCGIGINVNQEREELPAETRTPATSLRVATGQALDRGRLLSAVLAELEARYGRWLAEGLAWLTAELEARNVLAGRGVVVDGSAGTAGAIAPDGRLTVVLDDGRAVLVESGEIELDAR
jgi:BirA family transcriptional regulator, biotin operon repressor / biotin---[acetyl-CoA-carboxylase] ligase